MLAFAALCACLLALASSSFANPQSAYAETSAYAAEGTVVSEAQQQVEASAREYNTATENVKKLNAQCAENKAKIADISSKLDDQKEKSAQSMRTLYMMQNEGYSMVNMVLDSGSLNEFFQRIEYIECLRDQSVSEVQKYTNMKADSERAQVQLDADQKEAVNQAQLAADALEQAKAARQAAADSANAPELQSVDWSSDHDAFIAEWTQRIDAYLMGSALEGYGKNFAEAAWNYGVDPRWSPAISTTESGKGAKCAGAYNAWGWRRTSDTWQSFSSWDEAIEKHVAYLARVYGYTISDANAAKYCPPGDSWYATTVGEMQKI